MVVKIKKLFNKYEEIILYLIIGGLTTLINILTYYIVTHTFLNPLNSIELQLAEIISWFFSVVFAYFTNRAYVFKKKNNVSLKEFFYFVSSRILTLLIEMLIMYIFVSKLKLNDQVIKVIAQIVVIVLNFIFSKFLVFKEGYQNEKE